MNRIKYALGGMTMGRTLKSVTSIFILMLTVSLSQAVTIIQEQFLTTDYTVDTSIIGQNGGTGFSANWDENGGLSTDVNFYPRTSGLTYSGLNTAGGALEHFRNAGSPGSKEAIHDIDGGVTPITISGANQMMYMGFLFNISAGADLTVTYNDVSNRNSNFNITEGNVELEAGGKDGSTLSFGTVTAGTTNMLLLRVSDATSGSPNDAFYDSIEGWLNPNLASLGVADATGFGIISKFGGGNTDLMANDYFVRSSLDAGESVLFDEFFVTSDLAEVTVIPEPGTYALLILGLGALLGVRRLNKTA